MSIRELFQKGANKVLTQSQIDKIKKDLESEQLVRNSLAQNKKVRFHVDYSDPANFSFYGSSKKYYEDSITRTFGTYPYDGSLSEKKQWSNESSDLDLWFLSNIYPKSVGYVRLSSSQSIFSKGGPNNTPDVQIGEREELSKQYPEKQGISNIWNPEIYRNSNLYMDGSLGNTVEFWCKLEQSVIDQGASFIPVMVGNENGIRLQVSYDFSTEILSLVYLDDNDDGMGYNNDAQISLPGFFDATWNQYSFCFKNGDSNLRAEIYKNGQRVEVIDSLNNPVVQPTSQIESFLIINGTKSDISSNVQSTVDGLYIDDFRFWKKCRTEEEVGRYWFTSVHGGTNTDHDKYSKENNNIDLGVYYKFNEGYTGNDSIDSIALDYSGRISNGVILDYNLSSRTYINEDGVRTQYGSAFDESGFFTIEEEPDPIIYSSHPLVVDILEEYRTKGAAYDHLNNSSIYHSMPSWVTDEDDEFGGNILDLTQVLSSYFDSTQIQIKEMVNIKSNTYHSLENTNDVPYHLVRNALDSKGMVTPDLFVEATAFEEILSRGEQYLFENKIQEVKNLIYQNIYNNLPYIYKSKGTEKSFRNLLRCFGIDDEVVKINLYANEQDLNLEDSRSISVAKKKFIDFNNAARDAGVIYTKQDPQISKSSSYIKGMPDKKDASLSFTFETEVIFPKATSKRTNPDYYGYTDYEESIAHLGEYDATTDSYLQDQIFTLKAIKSGNSTTSDDVYFSLKFFSQSLQDEISVETKIFKQVYDNHRFNLAVRMVPEDTVLSLVEDGGDCAYRLELYCVSMIGDEIDYEDYVSTSISRSDAIYSLKKDKFLSIGALRNSNLPESQQLDTQTRLKMSSVLFWYDNVTNDEVKAHAKDVLNFGRMHPNENAYTLDSQFNGKVQVPRRDTLALHWDFSDVVTTDASGEFMVTDISESLDTIVKPVNEKAVQLDGVDDYLLVADSDNLSFTDGAQDLPFSISAWVYVGDSASDNGPFVAKADINSGDTEFIFKHANGVLQMFIYDSAGSATGHYIRAIANAATINSQEWHHVVVTYDGSGSESGVSLYTDSSLTASTKTTAGPYGRLRNTASPLTFGATADATPPNRVFEDKLADIIIFNKELTSQEVLELYNQGSVIDLADYSGYESAISWWKMGDDQDNGTTNDVLDYIGSNHAVLVNEASIVPEVSLPSDDTMSGRYGWFTDLVSYNMSGKGIFFGENDDQIVNREFLHSTRQRVPESVNPDDLVSIRMFDDEIYKKDPDIVRYFFSIEKSMYQVINDDIINFFATIKEFNDLIGQPVNRYRMQYKSLEKFRNRYFERIKNVPSLEKYVEIFKWIDTSIGTMLYQLIPASSAFSSGLRTMVESHVLERNKYWSKFPTMEISGEPPMGIVRGINELTYNWKDGHAPESVPLPRTVAFFDGTGDYIDIGDTPDLEFGTGAADSAFSLSTWVRMADPSASDGAFISKWTDSTTREYFFGHNPAETLKFEIYDISSNARIGLRTNATPFIANKWQNVIVTYDGTATAAGISFYVDGVKLSAVQQISVGSYTGVEPTTSPFRIGIAGASLPFEGHMSNVAVFPSALDLAQVGEIYRNQETGYSSAIARWRLDGIATDDVGSLNGTLNGDVSFVENPEEPSDENFLWYDQRVKGDDSFVSTGDPTTDENREKLRRVSTRNTEGLTKVVERNGVFVEEDRPLLRDSGGTVYEGQAYVTRALAKPYKLNLDISENIHGGVNYTPTAKDPNSFIRAATRFIPGAEYTGIETSIETNPITYEEWKKKYNVKRSVSITVTDTELSSIQTYDGDLIYPYYGEDYKDPAPVITGLHNDSYGEDAEIPAQGPFTEAWVGGNQHRHVDLLEQETVASGFIEFTSPTASDYDGRYIVLTDTNGVKISFLFDDDNSYATGQQLAPGFVGVQVNGMSDTPTISSEFASAINLSSIEITPSVVDSRVDLVQDVAGAPGNTLITPAFFGQTPPYDTSSYSDFSGGTSRPELYLDDGGVLKHPREINELLPAARYTREEVAKRPINIRNIKTGETRILGNYSRDYEVVQTSGRTQNNRWFTRLSDTDRELIPENRIPFLIGSQQNIYYPSAYSEPSLLPDRGRSEHVIVERFSAPGDPLTLSPGYMDRTAGEYSVYNSMNFRNLEERTKWQEELYTHSDKYEGSNGYKYSQPQLPIASVHKVNRNTNVRPSNIQHDNAYIGHQIPRSDLQYTFAKSVDEYISDESYTFYENFVIDSISYDPINKVPPTWNTNESDERTLHFNINSAVSIPTDTGDGLEFGSGDFTLSLFFNCLTPSLGNAQVLFQTVGYIAYIYQNQIYVRFTDSNDNTITMSAPGISPNNTWFHLAVRYDSSVSGTAADKFKMFINGSEPSVTYTTSGVYTAPVKADGNPLYLGNVSTVDWTGHFNGYMRDFVVCNVALSDTHILEMHEERNPSLHSQLNTSFSLWWKLGGPLDQITGAGSIKEELAGLNGTPVGTDEIELVNVTLSDPNDTMNGPRIKEDDSGYRVFSMLGSYKDHYTEVVDPPLASGMYRWISPTGTWSTPIKLSFYVYQGRPSGDYDLVDTPEAANDEFLWLQYKIGSGGQWNTVFYVEPDASNPITHKRYDVDLYEGQDSTNRLHIRWISRGPAGEAGQDVGTLDHDHWGISNISIRKLLVSEYYEELDIVKGDENTSVSYADYSGAGYRFIRNLENPQVANQRKNNKFVNILGTDRQASREYIEPAVEWNKPYFHNVMKHGAVSSLVEFAINPNQIGAEERYEQALRDIIFSEKNNSTYGSSRISTLSHSYVNNLEMFSNDQFNEDINLKKNSSQFAQTLNELFRRAELLYSSAVFNEIILPRHSLVGTTISRDRIKFDDYKVFWKDSFFDRIKCENSTKLGYKITDEFMKLFRQQYSVDVIDNFYKVSVSENTGFVTSSGTPQPIAATATISFGHISGGSYPLWTKGTIGLFGPSGVKVYQFADIADADNGTVSDGTVGDAGNILVRANWAPNFEGVIGTADSFAEAINLNQSADFSASYDGVKTTVITTQSTTLGTADQLPILLNSYSTDMTDGEDLEVEQFSGGHVEIFKVLGDLTYLGKDRMNHFLTRRDAPLEFVEYGPRTTHFYNSASSNVECLPSIPNEDSIYYSKETIRIDRSPVPSPQLYHNPWSEYYHESQGWINRKVIDSFHEFNGNDPLKPTNDNYKEFIQDVKLIGQNYSVIPEFRISEHMDYYVLDQGGNFDSVNYDILSIDGASYDGVEHTRTSGDSVTLGSSIYYSPYDNQERPYKLEDYSDFSVFNCAENFSGFNTITSPNQSSFSLENSVESRYRIEQTSDINYLPFSPLVQGNNAAGSFNLTTSEDFLFVKFDKLDHLAPEEQELELGTKPVAISIWAQHDVSNWGNTDISNKYVDTKSFGIWSIGDSVSSLNLFSNYFYSNAKNLSDKNLGITLAWDSFNPAINDSMPEIPSSSVVDTSTVYTFFHKNGEKAFIEPTSMNNIIVQFLPPEDRPQVERTTKLSYSVKIWLNGEELYGIHIRELSYDYGLNRKTGTSWYEDDYNSRTTDAVPPNLIVSAGVVVKQRVDDAGDKILGFVGGGLATLPDGDYPNASGADIGAYRYVEIDEDITEPYAYLSFRPHEGFDPATAVPYAGSTYNSHPYGLVNAPEAGSEEHLWVQYKIGSGSWTNLYEVVPLTSQFNNGIWDGSEEIRIQIAKGQTEANPLRIRFVSLSTSAAGTNYDHWGIDSVGIYDPKAGIRMFSPCPMGGFDRQVPNLATLDYPWQLDYDNLWDGIPEGFRTIDQATKFYIGNCDHFQNGQVDNDGARRHRFVGYLDELCILNETIVSNVGAVNIYNDGAPSNVQELVLNSKLNNVFKDGSSEYHDYDLGCFYIQNFFSSDEDSQPVLFDFNSATGPQISEQNRPFDGYVSGVKALTFRGTASGTLPDGDYPNPSGGVAGSFRWAELLLPLFSPVTVSFNLYEGVISGGAFDTTDQPDPDLEENLYLQYKVGNGDWINAAEYASEKASRLYRYFNSSQEVSIGDVGQDHDNPLYLRWVTVTSDGEAHWALGNIKILSTDRVVELVSVSQSDGSLGNEEFGDIHVSRGYSFMENNYSTGSINSLSKKLIAWHRIGVPKYDSEIVTRGWDSDFLDSYAITDNIKYIADSVSQESDISVYQRSSKISLKVNAVKKLLPYDGFYPQDRTVQISDLFVQKIEKDILPSSIWSQDGKQIYKEQAIQAAMQHFFSPGILYNSIRSGIACDWASYTNDSGMEPSYFGQKIEVRSTVNGQPRTQVRYSRGLVPYWYSSIDRVSKQIGQGTIKDNAGLRLQENYPNPLNPADPSDPDHNSEEGTVFGTDFQPYQVSTPYDLDDLNVESLIITAEPTTRLPFDAILRPYDYLIDSEESYYTPAGQDYEIKRKSKQFFMMKPSYYEDFVKNLAVTPTGPISAQIESISGNYENYVFPYFEIDPVSTNTDVRYELSINNFLAESVRFFLSSSDPFSNAGELTGFTSAREDEWGNFIKDEPHSMDVVISKRDKVLTHLTPHSYSYNRYSDNIQGGRYYGPPMLWYYDVSFDRIGPSDRDYRHREPAFAPYVPCYFYATTRARITFTPTEARHTLSEVHSNAVVEEISPGTDRFFELQAELITSTNLEGESVDPVNATEFWDTLPAWNSRMPLQSSVELFGVTRQLARSVDSQGSESATEEPGTNLNAWVIHTKFECPLFDFADFSNGVRREETAAIGLGEQSEESVTTFDGENYLTHYATYMNRFNYTSNNTDGRVGNGIWSGYGANPRDVLNMELAHPPAPTLSLLEVCKFQPGKKSLCQVASRRVISEAVVMIPFIDSSPGQFESMVVNIDGFNFLRLPTYHEQREKMDNQEPIYHRQRLVHQGIGGGYVYEPEVVYETTVTDLVKKMRNYVIPPRFDFEKNSSIQPFSMYIFEFEHILEKRDLEDIWQGLPPQLASQAILDDKLIEHDIGQYEIIDDQALRESPISTDLLALLGEDLKWLTFKVKKKAEINYQNITKDVRDDNKFTFTFKNQEVQPEYGYNYPYDYFTMIDRVQVEASVKTTSPKDYYREKVNMIVSEGQE